MEDQVKSVLNTIEQFKGDLTDSFRPHGCNRNYCNPQSLFDLTRKGNQTIFLCKYRQYHICDEDHCHCVSCPISGICYGTNLYSAHDSGDQRAWYARTDADDDPTVYPMPGYFAVEEPKSTQQEQPTFTSKLNKNDASEKIEQIVENLLYSPKRTTINEDHFKQRDKMMQRERDACIASYAQQKKPVNRVHLSMIADRHLSQRPLLVILERDAQLVSHLVDFVLQVCEIVERYTKHKICVTSVTLGVLYMMRQGHTLEGVTLLPMNPQLRDYLPTMNQLSKFGIEKRKLTSGQTMIVFAYDTAIRNGVELRDLCVKFHDTNLNMKALQ